MEKEEIKIKGSIYKNERRKKNEEIVEIQYNLKVDDIYYKFQIISKGDIEYYIKIQHYDDLINSYQKKFKDLNEMKKELGLSETIYKTKIEVIKYIEYKIKEKKINLIKDENKFILSIENNYDGFSDKIELKIDLIKYRDSPKEIIKELNKELQKAKLNFYDKVKEIENLFNMLKEKQNIKMKDIIKIKILLHVISFDNNQEKEEIIYQYKLNDINKNTKCIDLKNINQKIFDGISYIDFNQLEKIKIDNNEFDNKLDNINILTNPILYNLIDLQLQGNNISDISVLQFVHFHNLKSLSLSDNKIKDITSLQYVNFPYLKELYLWGNEIVYIDILEHSYFYNLNILDLSTNQINSIDSLQSAEFPELQSLNLSDNKITNINTLKDTNFQKLNELSLWDLNLTDIEFLYGCKFPLLQKINLCNNKIKDINVLSKFKNLNEIDIRKNDTNSLKKTSSNFFENFKGNLIKDDSCIIF